MSPAADRHGPLRFAVLGSGSRGNALYVEGGGVAVLVDCGFSGREVEARLRAIGRDAADLDALLVTHEHRDHVAGIGVLSRRYRLPVLGNAPTLEAAAPIVGRLHGAEAFATGEGFALGRMGVRSFALHHDTVEPVGYVFEVQGLRLGLCTDTGRAGTLIRHRLGACHALVIESNHDPDMLGNGPYPLPLQQRIRSSHGHLSNQDCGSLLADMAAAGRLPGRVILAHLSEENNTPALALDTVRACLGDLARGLDLEVASQHRPGPLVMAGDG